MTKLNEELKIINRFSKLDRIVIHLKNRRVRIIFSLSQGIYYIIPWGVVSHFEYLVAIGPYLDFMDFEAVDE